MAITRCDVESAERVGRAVAVRADGAGGLREDVERVVVAGDRQRAVALGVPRLQALRRGRQAVHADALRRDAGERVAALEQLRRVAREQVVTGGDVVPVQHDRAVEAVRVDGPVHEHPWSGTARVPAGSAVQRPSAPSSVPAAGR